MNVSVCDGMLCTESGQNFGPQCDDDEEAERFLEFIERTYSRKPTLISHEELCQALEDLRAAQMVSRNQSLESELRALENVDHDVRKAREAYDKTRDEIIKGSKHV